MNITRALSSQFYNLNIGREVYNNKKPFKLFILLDFAYGPNIIQTVNYANGKSWGLVPHVLQLSYVSVRCSSLHHTVMVAHSADHFPLIFHPPTVVG